MKFEEIEVGQVYNFIYKKIIIDNRLWKKNKIYESRIN